MSDDGKRWAVFTPHDKPCICWLGPVALHEGGCCFDEPPLDGDALGALPLCGHWHPNVPRPDRDTQS